METFFDEYYPLRLFIVREVFKGHALCDNMGNCHTVGPNEALVVSGTYIHLGLNSDPLLSLLQLSKW